MSEPTTTTPAYGVPAPASSPEQLWPAAPYGWNPGGLPTPPTPPRKRRRGAFVALALALGLGVGIAGIAAASSSSSTPPAAAAAPSSPLVDSAPAATPDDTIVTTPTPEESTPAYTPPAATGSTADQAYLMTLDQSGVTYGDPAVAEKVGRLICQVLAQTGDITMPLRAGASSGYTSSQLGAITGAAIGAYCPEESYLIPGH